MSDNMRSKIARALFDQDYNVATRRASDTAWLRLRDRTDEDSTWHLAADAVLAVIDVGEIRAEALRDLARVLQEALPESPSAAHTDRMKFAIGFLNASAADPYERKEDR